MTIGVARVLSQVLLKCSKSLQKFSFYLLTINLTSIIDFFTVHLHSNTYGAHYIRHGVGVGNIINYQLRTLLLFKIYHEKK